MTQSLLFSIIIANYNKGNNISLLLSSIFDDYSFTDFEVFFMDDASTDGSVAAAEQFPVIICRGEGRVGPATLRNRAARDARGEYLFFIDSDVILPPGTVTRFRELCLAGEAGAVSGLEVLPPVIDNWIGWFRGLQVQDNFGEFRLKDGPLAAWGSTCGGVKRELFFRAGGFNELYRGADVEDHELAIKLNEMAPMIFAPSMTYRHSYPDPVELVVKQFRRASQMVRLPEGTVLQSSLLFRWRFKGGHILSAAIVATACVALFNSSFGFLLLALLPAKLWLNRYLFCQSFLQKGPVFMVYAIGMSLVMGVSIVLGALYGKVRQVTG